MFFLKETTLIFFREFEVNPIAEIKCLSLNIFFYIVTADKI